MLNAVPDAQLSIVHATPHAWESGHEVNEVVGRLATEMAAKGHRVAVLAPSDARAALRESRKWIEAAGERSRSLFDGPWRGPTLDGADGPPLVALGAGIPLPRGPRPRAAPLPVDVSRRLEAVLAGTNPDIVHVHDPFAPSIASAALRHSSSLNVGTFHEPSERVLSTQVARPLVEIFFGRLDARTVSSRTTGDLIERFFPGAYELIEPGADRTEGWWPFPEQGRSRPLRIAFCATEERGALRLFLRALRRLARDEGWEAAVWTGERTDLRLSRAVRDRVRTVGPADTDPGRLIAGADVLCVCSGGPSTAPGLIRKALANATVPVVSHIPPYAELAGDGECGLLFPPGDAITLAGQLERLIGSAALRRELVRGGRSAVAGWEATGARFEEIYRRLGSRRHDPRGNPEARRRIARRREIHVDLHMHTDHSSDCATPVETLLATARDAGLGAIAITDHNEISGALAARELAGDFDVKVIVAEEVKTAEQGEVIGLFLERKIERGMTMAETIAEIRRQGGLVYVPHPFDRLHSVPDYEHLLDIVEEIDILEVFNPRVALTAFNEEAEKFAAKYRIVPGAGSDSHVAQGLGSVMIRVHDFDGPEEFLEAMRSADIVRKQKNLVYVQTLKWLQTGGGRGGKRVSGSPGRGRHRAGKR
jgi:hypothetical protein